MDMMKKDLERVYYDQFVALCPELSGLAVHSSEAPDFICTGAGRTIGVEIMRLYQPSSKDSPSPMAVYSFREQIMSRAKEIYLGLGVEPVHVGVLFDDVMLTDRDAIARKLADQVARLVRARPGDFVANSDDEVSLFPEFALVRVIRGDGLWTVSEAQMAPHLTSAMLQTVVDAKSTLDPSYRARTRETWLLLVLDRFPLAGSFKVQDEALQATYTAPFDRVYLLLSIERAVHRLDLVRSKS